MKMIRINGIERELPSESIAFSDYLSNLNQEIEQSNQVISGIRVNGKELSEIEEENLKDQPIESLPELEVVTSNPRDLAYQTLETLEEYTDRIIISIHRAAEYYKQKNFISADTVFAKAIDNLDLFVQTIGGIKLALRVGLNPKLALIEASLISTMNDLLDAKRQNNYVFLAELLEKDLVENLTEWKSEAFPLLKNIRRDN